jgi:hypothetical protein
MHIARPVFAAARPVVMVDANKDDDDIEITIALTRVWISCGAADSAPVTAVVSAVALEIMDETKYRMRFAMQMAIAVATDVYPAGNCGTKSMNGKTMALVKTAFLILYIQVVVVTAYRALETFSVVNRQLVNIAKYD